MKNADKLLFVVAVLACVGGVSSYVLLSSSADEKPNVSKVAPQGAKVVAWTDNVAKDVDASVWKRPELDTEEGWNYDLFSSPEISWNSKQKKYFEKELSPPPRRGIWSEVEIFVKPEISLSH